MNKKLLMFGGSFDPPHQGHKAMVKAAMSLIGPDLVVIVPCYIQPLKRNSASAEHRLNMTKLVFAGAEYLVLDHEILKGGPSYTIDTLKHLETSYKDHDIYLLMGQDSYEDLVKWKNYDDILKGYNIIVASRQGVCLTNKFPKARSIRFMTDFYHPASSTSARDGDTKYVDKNVMAYIVNNGLYRE